MIYHFLITTVVIFILMVVWFAIQNWARKEEGLPEDCDVLENRIGCHACSLVDKCDKEKLKVKNDKH